jgi:mono/diheme cytochrome c family protein
VQLAKWITGTICLSILAAFHVVAQNPRPITTGYPKRAPADPASLERGRQLYETSCAFCHGGDARGAEDGSNLLRSEIVLNDDNGELMAGIIRNGVGEMPKFDLTDMQIADLAAFIHSFPVAGYDISRQRPATIVVGDAKAGQAYFQAKCASCHSVSGDLKGFAARIADPRTMQQTWLMPGARGARPARPVVTTVTVTTPSGEKVNGELIRIDDFIVTLIGPNSAQRTFRRDGAIPRVDVHDPMRAHRDLLRVYTDKDIHNVTAYLESLK